MPRKKNEPIQAWNVFVCQLCADHPQFEVGSDVSFRAHMTDVHGFDMTQQFQKTTRMHLDAADYYQWEYEWKRDDVLFALQSIRNPRTEADRAYWSVE